MTSYAVLKRALDVVIVLMVLPVALLLAVAVAFCVGLTSGRPLLYGATRVGRGGRPFVMYKFRTMVHGAGGPAVTGAGDARVTPFGARLRRLKLDELPQLYNVLRGDMSLVGPRPEEPRFVARYTDADRRIFLVRPGLTGPATLAFRDEEWLLAGLAAEEVERAYVHDVLPHKLAIDRGYVQRRSLRYDATILLRTLAGLARPARGGTHPPWPGAARSDMGRNIGFNALTQAAPLVTAFVLAPYLIRHLGVDRFGVWALILSLIVTFSDLDGGVAASLSRFFAVYAARRDRAATGRLFLGAVSVFGALGFVVTAASWVAASTAVGLLNVPSSLRGEASHVLMLLGPLVTLALVSDAATSLLQATCRFRALAGATGLSCCCYLVGAVVVVDRGWGLAGLVGATAVRFALLFAIGLALGRHDMVFRRPLWPDLATRREFRGYAIRMQLSGLTNFLNGGMDALIIAALLPIRYVAVYAVGLQAAAGFRSLPLYVFPPVLTRLTTRFASDGLPGARREFRRLQVRWLPLSLAYGAVTAAAVPFVVLAWVGPRFLLSGEVAVLLVLAYTVHITLTAIRTCLVRAIGRPGLETRYSWLATVLNVLMTAALAVPFGVLGVVLGSAFGLAAGSVYFVVLCRRVVGVDESRLPPGWAMTTAFAVAVTVGGELLVRTNGGYGAVHLLLACLPVLAGLCIAMPLLTVSSGRSDAPEAAAAGTGSSTTTEAACRTA